MPANRESLTEDVLFGTELAAEEREMLRRLLRDDAALAEAFSTWAQVRGRIRADMEQLAGDRNLLVCYALDRAGRGALLNDEERQALRKAAPALERAMDTHPGLAVAVRRIQEDGDIFEQVWDEHYQPAEQPVPGRQDRRPVSHSAKRRSGTRRWAWRIGAAVAVAAFAAITTLVVQRDRDLITVATAENETRLVELADGSVVRLLGASKLSFDPAEEGASFRRFARLTGRAFFQIAPGEQTFTVETPTALATVLGTEFSVDASEDVTEIVLATGRLGVAPAAAPSEMVVLDEGQMSRVGRSALPSTPVPVDVAQELEWTGLFIFRGTPVQEIARHLSRHYGVAITVGPELQQEAIDGTFEQEQGIDAILETLGSTLGANVQPVPEGGYRIQ